MWLEMEIVLFLGDLLNLDIGILGMCYKVIFSEIFLEKRIL